MIRVMSKYVLVVWFTEAPTHAFVMLETFLPVGVVLFAVTFKGGAPCSRTDSKAQGKRAAARCCGMCSNEYARGAFPRRGM